MIKCIIRPKSTPHCYFDTCFIHNTGGVSDKQWHDSLFMYYTDKESCQSIKISSYIVRKTCVNITEWGGFFGFKIHLKNLWFKLMSG